MKQTQNYPKIAALFTRASSALAYPKLRLHIPPSTNHPEGAIVLLKLAGTNSRYAGTVTVTNGLPYGDPENLYYGRIDSLGHLALGSYARNNYVSESTCMLTALAALETSPTEYALQFSQATCSCMFCGRELLRNTSKLVGYGSICADKWGLPYPTEADVQDSKNSDLLNQL